MLDNYEISAAAAPSGKADNTVCGCPYRRAWGYGDINAGVEVNASVQRVFTLAVIEDSLPSTGNRAA